MARNLILAGHEVHGLVRSSRAAELREAGGLTADVPAEVAQRVETLITMLPDAPEVEDILFGPQGVAVGARRGLVVIDASTISPTATRSCSERLSSNGVAMLDAPVSGGQRGAIDGTLTFMVGGDPSVFERCQPIFEVLGKRAIWIGASGAGQVTKACNQAIIAVSMMGIAEALLLAIRAGVDPERVREALLGGFAGSPILENQGRRMLERDFVPGFRAGLHYKDIGIGRHLADSVGSPALALGLAQQLFSLLIESGHRNDDHSSVITVLEGLSQSELGAWTTPLTQ
jgi:2-hydroxy-3-oxopropionate reductase